MSNYYEILGVDKNASLDEIKIAYRKLAQQYHPDKNNGDTNKELLFKQISSAYKTLKNTEARRLYDETGKDDFTRINHAAETVLKNIALNYIQQSIQNGELYPFNNLITGLTDQIRGYENTIVEFKAAIETSNKFMGRIKRKDESNNVFENIITDKIIEIEGLLVNQKEAVIVHKKALDLLSQYESIEEVTVHIGVDFAAGMGASYSTTASSWG